MSIQEAHRLIPDSEEAAPEISVVVPVVGIYDEPGSIYDAFAPELRKTGRSFEFLFVVDGDRGDAAEAVSVLKRRAPGVSAYRLGRRFGEATALTVGFRRARGRIVITASPYMQVDPAEVGGILAELDGETDIVVTRRSPRTDSFFNRTQSAVFHLAVAGISGRRFHDITCGLRAMTAEVARSLKLYGDQHRFIPLLAVRDGFRVKEVAVRQHAGERRWRVFGPATYLTRLFDILTVFFLIRFTKRPLRFFGSVGSGIFSAGFALCLWLTWVKFAYAQPLMERPLLLLGVLLVVLGIQTASIGLLGEIIIFTHGQDSGDYRAEEIGD